MNNEKLIHIRFEHDNAVESKRDILSSEIDLLKISQRLKNYRADRLAELELKAKLERKFKALKLDIGRLQNLLPKIKVPKILKAPHKRIEEKEEMLEKYTKEEEEKHEDIESQLQEIQRRLNAL